ncbi:anthranilate synthase component II [Actinokineospora spheciospongiae]|uniref:anthranilate synthase component II n=1 Tax=Actinokineospora spheciospongiae TaxID=909613 RepID=UPI000D70DCDE|nr:aminodeoxychorismate/anthranilate synthase component II [Actinokineospora spheciospongiae]PWW58258.1 anthranilate synthase component 2 [Actinokineospora spheciospongiae]
MRALLVDAYDSFTYIIDQYLRDLGLEVGVVRNDRVDPASLAVSAPARPDFVVLGPGPGHPADSGYVHLLGAMDPAVPVLGICLGHQAIGMASGGRIERATPRHGKTSEVLHDGTGCFRDIPTPVRVARYHSLVVEENSIPDDLVVTARAADDGHVMGLRHRSRPIESVQFHPESIGTDFGADLLLNFITTHVPSKELMTSEV